MCKKKLGYKLRNCLAMVFFVLAIPILLQSCVYYRTNLEKEYLRQADEAYDAGEYEKAEELYSKTRFVSLKRYPKYKIALINIKLGHYEKARKQINRLQFTSPKNTLVKELDAYWYYVSGDIEESIKRYKRLLEHTPYNTRVLNNLASIYTQKQNYSLALEYFEKSISVEALEINFLDAYITVLSSITKDEGANSDSELKKRSSLAMVGEQYLDAYKAHKISLKGLYKVGEAFSRADYFEFSFPIFHYISELNIEELDTGDTGGENAVSHSDAKDNEQEGLSLIQEANITLASKILSNEYVPQDTDALTEGLKHLKIAIEIGYGKDEAQNTILIDILDSKISNSLQKKQVITLYYEKGLIQEADYKERLKNLNQNS